METIKTEVTTKKLGRRTDLLTKSTHHRIFQQVEILIDHFEVQGKKFSLKAK